MMQKKVFIKTFGCQMNEYDSNRIYDTVKNIGYIRNEDQNDVDCYILNTCHIRDKAKEKVYHEIGRVKKSFRGKKKPIVVVAGCVAQAENEEMLKREPYIDIVLISKNSTYIAKKTKTFEEEKTVAEKAPIDGIKISDLNSSNKTKKKLKKNNKFSYYIKVADFYYKKSAKNMSNKIKSEVKLKNIKIIELTKTNYRLLLGPFNDIQSLKDSFEKMNSLYFENLEIIKDA